MTDERPGPDDELEENVDPTAEPNPDEKIDGAEELPDEVRDGDLAAHEPEE